MKFRNTPVAVAPSTGVRSVRTTGSTGTVTSVPRLEGHSEILDADLEPGAREVRDRLLENGASLGFTGSVLESVSRIGAAGAFAVDAAARSIGASFSILPSPKRGGGTSPRVYAFVGPTGAGKTTTMAKVGRRLTSAGRRAVLASLDAAGMGAFEGARGLTADLDRTELPLVAVKNAGELRRAVRNAAGTEVVLLDTPGLSPRDDEGLDELARVLAALGARETLGVFLVLPATKSRAALRLASSAFARANPTACVLTKLDETEQPGTALEEIRAIRLPFAFLCDGQDARGHVARPTPDRFADLFLRGRMR